MVATSESRGDGSRQPCVPPERDTTSSVPVRDRPRSPVSDGVHGQWRVSTVSGTARRLPSFPLPKLGSPQVGCCRQARPCELQSAEEPRPIHEYPLRPRLPARRHGGCCPQRRARPCSAGTQAGLNGNWTTTEIEVGRQFSASFAASFRIGKVCVDRSNDGALEMNVRTFF